MRDRGGNLIPELSDYLRAVRLIPELESRGLILNPDPAALVELGRALREVDQDQDQARDLVLTEMVREIQKRNRAVKQP